ncbi:MAG: hypothetical protein ABI534_07860 [Chloroflexota bacterium]
MTAPLGLLLLVACGGTQTPVDAAALAATLPSSVGDVVLRVSTLSAADLVRFGPEPLSDAVEAHAGAFEEGHAAEAAGEGIQVFAYAQPAMDAGSVARDYLTRLGDGAPAEWDYSEPESVIVGTKQVMAVTLSTPENPEGFTFYAYPIGGTIYVLQILDERNVPAVLAELP